MSDPSQASRQGSGGTACERIVTAVADAKGVDATSLPPLYEAVDPECLNGIFCDTATGLRRTDGVISFRWADCHVVVEGERVTVSVESPVTASSLDTTHTTGQSEGWLD